MDIIQIFRKIASELTIEELEMVMKIAQQQLCPEKHIEKIKELWQNHGMIQAVKY